ncbi:MAG: acetamidase/formamidase family protein [Clostridia bacterium]|nr:acetamidase/formamidase family protein [Clostridia bacterium]
MQFVKKEHAIYSMTAKNAPAAYAENGETLVFETADCFSEQLKTENDHLGAINWDTINPATGPVFINGAEKGDTLKIEILKIALEKQAVIVESPGEGITSAKACEDITKVLPVADGKNLIFNDRIIVPVRAMIGVIGTAPESESISTGTPSEHGGNMDCKEIGEGTTLYLPVNVPGALLAMGDLHAAMGDGEVCVCGAEISGQVTVKVTVIKGQPLPLPFLVTASAAMAIYSEEGLDAAAIGATLRMRDFLIDQAHFLPHEAGMLLSLAGDLRICQAVDPNKTVRMELPLKYLNDVGYVFP